MINQITDDTKTTSLIGDMAKELVGISSSVDIYLCAYLAYVIQSAEQPYTTLADLLADASENDADILGVLTTVFAGIDLQMLSLMGDKITKDKLLDFLQIGPNTSGPRGSEGVTPEGITALVCSILNIGDNDLVIDFGSGLGGFLEYASKENNKAHFIGVELSDEYIAAAKIRARFSLSSITYVHADMFEYFEKQLSIQKVDKAFSNYPWGLRARQLDGSSEYLSKVFKGVSEYKRPVSADWVFNRLLLDSVNKDGVAVGIMTNGSAFNGADTHVRKYFIENGWVRAAISLPEGVFFPWTNIGTTLLVLCRGNSEGVRLVDATDLGTRGRRGVDLSEGDVREILHRMNGDSDMSALVSAEILAKRDYTLLASRYLRKEIVLNNPVRLESVVRGITRGAGLRAQELDQLACNEDTNIRYLNLANITDGSMDTDLPFLKKLDSKLEKYCLKTGDLLLSKNGAPYKVAVAEVPEGQQILANGNLYIVRLDTEKVDPYYVAAFLSSSDGEEILAQASKGTSIPNLPVGELKRIEIPLEDWRVQKRIATSYRAKVDEINTLKLRLFRARNNLSNLFDREA